MSFYSTRELRRGRRPARNWETLPNIFRDWAKITMKLRIITMMTMATIAMHA